MSWVLYLDKPWVQAKHILLISICIVLGLQLHGYSPLLMVGNALFLFTVLVMIPGQIRHEHVKAATKVMLDSSNNERSLTENELWLVIRAIETAGRLEFNREAQSLLDEMLPKDEGFVELLTEMEGLPRGLSRRALRVEVDRRLEGYLLVEKRKEARRLSEERRLKADELHAAEKAARIAREAERASANSQPERSKPKSNNDETIIKIP